MSIPTGLLSPIRRQAERLLPDSCTVTRITRVLNDAGGWTETTVESDAIACRLMPLSGRERVLGGRVVDESDAMLTLPYDVDVTGSDRITHDGDTYEIVDIEERSQHLLTRVAIRHQP